MKTNQIIRGGEFDYSAPTVEVLDIPVEQGFAVSIAGDDVYSASWNYNNSWTGNGEDY